MKGFMNEFKKFISRGNVVDMAVGVIMGSTFTKIVTSLVNDVMMPAIGMVIGGTSFENFKYVIEPATETAIYYGKFIQTIVDFLLVAIVVFIMVKLINALHKKEEAPKAPAGPTDAQITNDLLKENNELLKKMLEK